MADSDKLVITTENLDIIRYKMQNIQDRMNLLNVKYDLFNVSKGYFYDKLDIFQETLLETCSNFSDIFQAVNSYVEMALAEFGEKDQEEANKFVGDALSS